MKRTLHALVAAAALAAMPVLAQTSGSGAGTGTTGAGSTGVSGTGSAVPGVNTPRPGSPSVPPEVVEGAPAEAPHILPGEPTSAGAAAPAVPHGEAVRDARKQYKRDKVECRQSSMSRQEYRDCRKAAKTERNNRIEEAPEEPRGLP